MARLALAHTVSEPAAILSSLATQDGGAERRACCVHMTAQFCGRRRVRDEKPRERESGGSDAEERSCKYRKLHRVESGGEWQADRQQQAVSRA